MKIFCAFNYKIDNGKHVFDKHNGKHSNNVVFIVVYFLFFLAVSALFISSSFFNQSSLNKSFLFNSVSSFISNSFTNTELSSIVIT